MKSLVLSTAFVTFIGFAACNADDLTSRTEAAYLSRLEFKNGEVIIQIWSSTTPDDASQSNLSREVNTTIRCLVDYEKQRCFWLRKMQSKVGNSNENKTFIQYASYHDGHGIATPHDYLPIGTKQDFYRFLPRSGMFRVEYAGMFSKSEFVIGGSQETIVDQSIRLLHKNETNNKPSIRDLPDGGKIITYPQTGDDDFTITTTFDADFVLPVRTSVMKELDGKENILLREEVEFEKVNGFERAKKVTIDGQEFLKDANAKQLPATKIKTISYQWLQFNEEELKWPDEAQVMSDNKEMIKFLNPEQTP